MEESEEQISLDLNSSSNDNLSNNEMKSEERSNNVLPINKNQQSKTTSNSKSSKSDSQSNYEYTRVEAYGDEDTIDRVDDDTDISNGFGAGFRLSRSNVSYLRSILYHIRFREIIYISIILYLLYFVKSNGKNLIQVNFTGPIQIAQCSPSSLSKAELSSFTYLDAEQQNEIPLSNHKPLLKDSNNDSTHSSSPLSQSSSSKSAYSTVPSLDLLCRTYWDSLFELLRFMLAYTLFWPYEELNNNLILIVDKENEADRKFIAVLAAAWRMFKYEVYLETEPPAGTLTANARNVGYSRTQWSNFYSDLYSKAEYVGIVDTDGEVFRRPNIEDLFIDGKAVMRFYAAHKGHRHWESTEWVVGKPSPGDFMVSFPVIIKRSHFALIRSYIADYHNKSFELVWREMQDKFGGEWGQFIIMGTYLYHFHYSEYEWRMEFYHPPNQGTNGMVNTSQHRIPTPYLFKHIAPFLDDNQKIINRLYQQLCVSSNYLAVDCVREKENEAMKRKGYLWLWTPAYTIVGEDDNIWNTADYATNPNWEDRAQQVFDLNNYQYGGEKIWRRTQYNLEERTITPGCTLEEAREVMERVRRKNNGKVDAPPELSYYVYP